MKPTAELPDDPALPGLAAIRVAGLARALPALGLDGPAEVLLRGYTPGDRATLEVRAEGRHLAIKAYAEDPAPEAELYQALAAAGLAGDSGPRAPRLVAWERDLRVLVLGWLDGRPVHRLVKEGRGGRAGELAATWIRCAASLPLRSGQRCGAGSALYLAGRSVAALAAADADLGAAAGALADKLARAEPPEDTPRLVHGTLYDRHVLDMGDGPGVIDWQRCGQGPLEGDAAMFLATIWRVGLRDPAMAAEAARAEQAFLAGTAGLLDERALAWHGAAALLRLAGKVNVVRGRRPDWRARARALLGEATRLAERAVRPAAFTLEGSALEVALRALCRTLDGSALALALRALSTRPATPQELQRIHELLDEVMVRR